jgi:hypothetical protein
MVWQILSYQLWDYLSLRYIAQPQAENLHLSPPIYLYVARMGLTRCDDRFCSRIFEYQNLKKEMLFLAFPFDIQELTNDLMNQKSNNIGRRKPKRQEH